MARRHCRWCWRCAPRRAATRAAVLPARRAAGAGAPGDRPMTRGRHGDPTLKRPTGSTNRARRQAPVARLPRGAGADRAGRAPDPVAPALRVDVGVRLPCLVRLPGLCRDDRRRQGCLAWCSSGPTPTTAERADDDLVLHPALVLIVGALVLPWLRGAACGRGDRRAAAGLRWHWSGRCRTGRPGSCVFSSTRSRRCRATSSRACSPPSLR
jgi:hypothetical protein